MINHHYGDNDTMNIEKKGRYWQVTGLPGHTLLLNNKQDAKKHLEYLKKKEGTDVPAIRRIANRIRLHGDAYSSGLATEIINLLNEGG